MSFLNTLDTTVKTHTTTIQGVDYPLREFSSAAWSDVMQTMTNRDENTTTEEVVNATCEVAIKGMEGLDTEITPQLIGLLQEKVSNGNILEYMRRLTDLNNFGLDQLKEAEKNSETALSNATE